MSRGSRMVSGSDRAAGDQEKQKWEVISPEHKSRHGPRQKTIMPRWRQKGKEKTSMALACTWLVDHQISLSLTLLLTLVSVHALLPSTHRHTSKFFQISYYNPATGTYALGWDDIFFVFFWIVVFTFARCFTMTYILAPLGSLLGLARKKMRVRFSEQAWIFLYYGFFWGVGIHIMYHSDYWLNLRALWTNWPVREMDGLAKWYYLVQFAFWLQQIVIVNIEERRKDHWQMFSHHIITCILIFTSYGYHQSKVGNLILCLMDIVDILFAGAKILKYLGFQLLCDVAFGVFMVSYFIARHVLYLSICWSIYKHIPEEIQYGCYKGSVTNLQGPLPVPNDWDHLTQPFRDPVGLVCWNNNIKWAFLGGLLMLQIIFLVWFGMIIKIAYKVLSGQGADDDRSDDEDEEEEEEEEEENAIVSRDNYVEKVPPKVEAQPLIGKDVLSRGDSQSSTKPLRPATPARRSSRRKENGHSSSVNLLAGKGDRKDLLGRIGCDKPSSS